MALGKKIVVPSTTVELKTDDGTPTGVTFTIDALTNPRAQRANQSALIKAAILAEVDDAKNMTKEEQATVLAYRAELNPKVIAQCVTAWDWNGVELFEGDGPFDKPCTPENVEYVLTVPIGGIDILGQITGAVNELGKPKPPQKKQSENS